MPTSSKDPVKSQAYAPVERLQAVGLELLQAQAFRDALDLLSARNSGSDEVRFNELRRIQDRDRDESLRATKRVEDQLGHLRTRASDQLGKLQAQVNEVKVLNGELSERLNSQKERLEIQDDNHKSVLKDFYRTLGAVSLVLAAAIFALVDILHHPEKSFLLSLLNSFGTLFNN